MNDFDPGIAATLRSFFAAMRVWELACTERDLREKKQQLSDSELREADEAESRELNEVFRRYCTTWDAPFRMGTYARGAEYDPDGERILTVEQGGNAATVYTEQTTARPNRKYVYKLKKTGDGWRLLDERYIVGNEGLEPWFL